MMETKEKRGKKVGGGHGERDGTFVSTGSLSGLEGSSRFNRGFSPQMVDSILMYRNSQKKTQPKRDGDRLPGSSAQPIS